MEVSSWLDLCSISYIKNALSKEVRMTPSSDRHGKEDSKRMHIPQISGTEVSSAGYKVVMIVQVYLVTSQVEPKHNRSFGIAKSCFQC